MMELAIMASVTLWTVLSVKNSRRHKCCGDCVKCMKKAD